MTGESPNVRDRMAGLVAGCVAAAMAAWLATFLLAPVVLVDTWGYMAYGRLVIETGGVATRDPFSYVPTIEPWVYHWASDVLTYWVASELGGRALIVVRAGLWLGACLLVYATAREQRAAWWIACLVLLGTAKPTAAGFAFFRPQGITYLLFALELYLLLSGDRRGWKRLIWLVPLMAVWANFHGGVTAGIGVLGAFVIGRVVVAIYRGEAASVLPLAAIAIGSALATLLTPWGFDYWRFALRASMTPRENIIEWGSALTLPPGPFFTLSALAVGAGIVALMSDLKKDLGRLLILTVTLLAAVTQIRHIPFFGIAAAALLPAPLGAALRPLLGRVTHMVPSRVFPGRRSAQAVTIATAMATLFVAGREALEPVRWRVHAFGRHVPRVRSFPFGAVEFIRVNGLAGNVATPYVWGAFVMWKLYPLCRVSFDSRAELYAEAVANDNWNFLFGKPGWERLLTDYPTEIVLTERRLPQHRLMRRRNDWRMIFEDDLSGVFVPNRPEYDRQWKMPDRVRPQFP